ncbi:hypothetical protein EC991_007827 [Linnemannia zychae]|nr:hypothetical protein EC991_007827 [Linnemannia zychae]
MISSAFGGHVQSASGSQERHDYLHQQQLVSARSIETPLGSTFGIDALYDQSFSTFSAAVAPLVKKDTEVVKMDGVAVERGVLEEPHEPSYESNTYTAHRHRQSTNSSRPVLLSSTSVSTMSTEITVPQTTSAGNGGSWSDDDEQASSVSTDTEVELESGVEDQTGSLHVHRPTRRMNSTRTGGKSHYSAYRRRIQTMDGTNSMQFFNRHLQHVVQQNHGVSGGGSHNGRRPAGCAMDASSPSIFSNATLSPASCTTTTSIHSALTTTSFASSASGFTAITGTTSSSVYALSSSDPSETSISRRTTADSATSTLCGVTSATTCNNGKAALHAKGARRFIRWIHPDIINQRTDSKTPPPPSQPRLQRNGKKGPKRPDAKAFFSNERTYMHWIKFGLLLGSMALTLVSFGKSMGLQVGLFLVLVAMSTLVYATTIFHLRDRWMKQFRLDVLYYDRLGPSVLFIALFLAFATNVALTVLKLMDEDGSDNDGLNFYNGHLDI